jgi:hypothetical protein
MTSRQSRKATLLVCLAAAASLHAATLAYVDGHGRIIYQAQGAAPRVAATSGYGLQLSTDGKLLLYTREERDQPRRTLVLWDAQTGRSRDLVTGLVSDPHFSSEGTRIAFLRLDQNAGSDWCLWVMPLADPGHAVRVSPMPMTSVSGWAPGDAAIAGFDEKNLYWIGLDGNIRRTISLSAIYREQFEWMSTNVLRLAFADPNLLLVSAYRTENPPGALLDDGEPELNSTIALYDLRSGQATPLLSPRSWGHDAVWSPGDSWIYFTRLEGKHKYAVWRMHPNGNDLERVVAGSQPAVAR